MSPAPRSLLQLARRPLQDAARDITALGGVVVLSLMTLITCGFLAFDGKHRMALFVCASMLSGSIAGTILRDVFVRPRPDIVPGAAYASGLSFVSGHSMMSAIMYLTLGALLADHITKNALRLISSCWQYC